MFFWRYSISFYIYIYYDDDDDDDDDDDVDYDNGDIEGLKPYYANYSKYYSINFRGYFDS